jgi:hypothetical protein
VAKKPVKNVDLWQKLDDLNQKHQVSWFWVKGHSGDKGNDTKMHYLKFPYSLFRLFFLMP